MACFSVFFSLGVFIYLCVNVLKKASLRWSLELMLARNWIYFVLRCVSHFAVVWLLLLVLFLLGALYTVMMINASRMLMLRLQYGKLSWSSVCARMSAALIGSGQWGYISNVYWQTVPHPWISGFPATQLLLHGRGTICSHPRLIVEHVRQWVLYVWRIVMIAVFEVSHSANALAMIITRFMSRFA